MLRFWITVSLRLMMVFTGIGLLLSRQWGWSEYASDRLYLVYDNERGGAPFPYFLLNTDGSGEERELAINHQSPTSLDCSPDGRTVAFLLDSRHLYIVNESGVVYEQMLDSAYDKLGVTNRGEAYLYKYNGFRTSGNPLIVDERQRYTLVPPDQRDYNNVQVTSAGSILWGVSVNRGIAVGSGGGIEMFLPNSLSISWLGSEAIFTFAYMDGRQHNGNLYLGDPRTQVVVRFPQKSSAMVLSPDGFQNAENVFDDLSHREYIFLSNVFSSERKPIMNTIDGSWYQHNPVCFLTFRPQMLIAGS